MLLNHSLLGKTFVFSVLTFITTAAYGEGEPVITQQPVSKTVYVGSNVTFTVVASGGPLSYQWYLDDVAMPGKTGSSLSITDAQYTDSGGYTVEVSNSNGSVMSDPAGLIVIKYIATYNGLFYETNAIRHESSGFLTMRRSSTNFTGRIFVDGLPHAFSGRFTNNLSTRTIVRTNQNRENLTISLEFDASTEQIRGSLSSTSWTSPIIADLSAFNLTNAATAFEGKYTMVIPGLADGAQGPVGSGAASVIVSTLGKVTCAGNTADGQLLHMNLTYLSSAGNWPFYATMYMARETNAAGRGFNLCRGSMLGWLTFTNNAPSGSLSWIKTTSTNMPYTAGFTNDSEVISSPYVYIPGTLVIGMTNGLLTFSGGNLVEPFSANVLLKTNNTLVALQPMTNKAVVSLIPKTGIFRGTFRHPENTNVVTKFSGALLQQQNYGAGYFAGTNHAGLLTLDPQ